jgi:hypothetical protein
LANSGSTTFSGGWTFSGNTASQVRVHHSALCRGFCHWLTLQCCLCLLLNCASARPLLARGPAVPGRVQLARQRDLRHLCGSEGADDRPLRPRARSYAYAAVPADPDSDSRSHAGHVQLQHGDRPVQARPKGLAVARRVHRHLQVARPHASSDASPDSRPHARSHAGHVQLQRNDRPVRARPRGLAVPRRLHRQLQVRHATQLRSAERNRGMQQGDHDVQRVWRVLQAVDHSAGIL